MSGLLDSSQDNSSLVQERVLVEPSNDEQTQNGDDTTPPPGSLSFFRDGSFKFPKALLEGGGFEILRNPIARNLQEFLLSASIFDVNTSMEGVLLYMLEQALANRDKNWPELLLSYAWFPSVLAEVSQPKRTARWEWIISHEHAEPADLDATPHHSFWLQGFGNDKIKDDRMIESNGYKVLNYAQFRGIIRSVASEIQSNSLGPIEIGNLGRRHWNALKEPEISDLKKRVVRKKKKSRAKSAGKTPAKQPTQNPPAPADLPEGVLGQPAAPAQAADQAPPVGPAGVDAANGGNLAAQPGVVQEGAPGGPHPPTNPY